MEETVQHAVTLAGCVGILLGAWWSGTATPEPPENVDGLAVEES